MANKLATTRIRLPPIDDNIHDLVTGFPLKRTDAEKNNPNVLTRQPNIPDQNGGFPPIVQPPHRQQFDNYNKKKSLRHPSTKITHTEKLPTQFPGKTFAVLPPIGGSCVQEENDQLSEKNPSIRQSSGTATKVARKRKVVKKTELSDSKFPNESSTVKTSKKVVRRQISVLAGLAANIDRKQEYEVRHNNSHEHQQTPSKAKDLNSLKPSECAETVQPQSDLQNDGDDEDDDDDTTMMKLSEVLQFLEWSSELREFLDGKNSLRRDATCSALDPMLPHAVDVIRDMLLKQTMEELCMMW